ncbi:uncharacterized protein CDAR_450091 [Caerostris darwini]|uniref:Uncharacterized protein n=1 Tax=Caerostris darwini TaxID=1538125 RepID=A0AAV4QS52_9ARAC|nr:uncharacterized protein CDAR_450091 [Caerostris darwini]
MQLRYLRWAKHIALIEKCRIPHRILYGNFIKATLHIFTGASSHGYACCAFLRCEDEGEISILFELSKNYTQDSLDIEIFPEYQGKDNVERVARLRVAKGEIIRPIQRIYLLEVSSPEILNDVPVRVKNSSDTSDNDNNHTVSKEKSFEPKDLPKEQLETLKRSRCGRQIVPVKRLDL